MRYLRAGGAVVSLAVLLAGFLLDMDALIPAALYICAGAMALGALDKPESRVAPLLACVCALAAGLAALASQNASPVFVLPGNAGDTLIPAGESAYRTMGACVYSLLIGCWLGATAMEAAFARGGLAPAGYAAFPVRACALLISLPGMFAAAAPGLSEWIRLPAIPENALALLCALSTPAVAAYAACSRYRGASALLLLIYLLSAAYTPALFASRAFFALVFSFLLCVRGDGRFGFAFALPPLLVIAIALFYRAEESALTLYLTRLSDALRLFFTPGGFDWAIRLYARLGLPGLALAGAFGGALCFFLGKLLRDSFVYAAPAMALLGWGCLFLAKGAAGMPTLADGVLFLSVYGLCLIVGAARRAKKSSKRR